MQTLKSLFINAVLYITSNLSPPLVLRDSANKHLSCTDPVHNSVAQCYSILYISHIRKGTISLITTRMWTQGSNQGGNYSSIEIKGNIWIL